MSEFPRDWRDVLSEHVRVVSKMESLAPTLDTLVEVIIACLRAGGRVYVAGNGGSAADAQHIAAELLGRYQRKRRALPAIALTTDTSALTAISNDVGYERVFSRQLEGLVQRGDMVWLLSTSGDSPNVLEAARVAAERGAIVIGFTGQTGGKLAELCTHVLRAPHTAADRIQEAHELAYHYICEKVEAAFA
ncbi:MAG: SIS domain-containing protein [Phycisphaerae bacterium]